MHKIAVIGDKDSVCGFSCLGLETVVVYAEKDAKREFRRLVNSEYAIIYVTEKTAEMLSSEISQLYNCVTPAVILIPGVSGNTGDGLKSIDRSVERAVGSLI